MKNLVIIGAGGFGREVYQWALTSPGCGQEWRIKGFIDDAPLERLKGRLLAPLLGGIHDYNIEINDVFAFGIGTPVIRKKLYHYFEALSAQFVSIIHPSAVVCSSAQIGAGAVICPYALISADTSVARGSVIYYHASIDHDSIIGEFCQVSGHCDVMGGAKLGSQAFLGSHVAVLPGITIGDEAIVGAGAVVTHDIPSRCTVCGVPARPISQSI